MIKSATPGRLLTATEVATSLGVSRGTVSRWATSGRLVPVHVTSGGLRLFAEADVMAMGTAR